MLNIHNNKGISLLEVVAILLIAGILGAFVLSRGMTADSYVLETQDDIVKSHLRYAQSRAVQTATGWGIKFAGTRAYQGRSYSNYWLFKLDDGEDVRKPFTVGADGKYTVLFDDGSVGVWPLVINSQTAVIFNMWGTPVTSGGVPLNGNITLTISNADDIVIQKDTGYID